MCRWRRAWNVLRGGGVEGGEQEEEEEEEEVHVIQPPILGAHVAPLALCLKVELHGAKQRNAAQALRLPRMQCSFI